MGLIVSHTNWASGSLDSSGLRRFSCEFVHNDILPCSPSGHIYRLQGKVMFSEVSVSHSVHKGGADPSWRHNSQIQTLDADPAPWRQILLRVTSSCDHCTSRYACYWNAFLFKRNFRHRRLDFCSRTVTLLIRTTTFYKGWIREKNV